MSKNERTIEQKMAELEALLAWFDGDEFSVEESLERYKQAAKLVTEIEHDLDEVKNTITVLAESFDRA